MRRVIIITALPLLLVACQGTSSVAPSSGRKLLFSPEPALRYRLPADGCRR